MQFSKWVTLGFGALCLVMVGGVLNQPHIFYMAALLLTLPLISYCLGWLSLRGLRFQRILPGYAWAGQPTSIRYTTDNPTRVPRFFVAVQDDLPDWVRNENPETQLFNVGANDRAMSEVPICATRRGVLQLDTIVASAIDPIGVFAFTSEQDAGGELVVYPRPRRLAYREMSGAERFGEEDSAIDWFEGAGVTPDGVRPWQPGDRLRRIHWRQTARTGNLTVVQYEELRSDSMLIWVDVARRNYQATSDQGAEALELAVDVAASLANASLERGAAFAVVSPRAEFETDTRMLEGPSRGLDRYHAALELLARAELIDGSDAPIERSVPLDLPSGTTICFVTGPHGKPSPLLARFADVSRCPLVVVRSLAQDHGGVRMDSDAGGRADLVAYRVDTETICLSAAASVNHDSVAHQ